MSRIRYKSYSHVLSIARSLRKGMTNCEKLLWEEIRFRKLLGYKFLRQHPVFYRIDKNFQSFCIADFYCSELRLIIELDGKIHDFRKKHDIERDSMLSERGFHVIRIRNEEIDDIEKVISDLKIIIIKLHSSQNSNL